MSGRFTPCCLLILTVYVCIVSADYTSDLGTVMGKLSGKCYQVAVQQFSKYQKLSREEGCKTLRNDAVILYTVLKGGCTEDEYNSVKDVICVDVYESELREALDKLPAKCQSTVQSEFGNDESLTRGEICEKLKTDITFQLQLLNGGCPVDDYDKVKHLVCANDYSSQLAAVLLKLPNKCQTLAMSKFETFKTMTKKEGCEKMKTDAIFLLELMSGGCTPDEFNNVKSVICGEDDATKISKVVAKLSTECQPSVSSELDKISSLSQEEQCKKLQTDDTIKQNIMNVGCTATDFKSVEDAACKSTNDGNTGSRDCNNDEENKVTSEKCDEDPTSNIINVVTELPDTCRPTLLSEIAKIGSSDAGDLCRKLKNDDTIQEKVLAEGCTTEDYNNVKKAVCKSGGSLIRATSVVLALGAILILSAVHMITRN